MASDDTSSKKSDHIESGGAAENPSAKGGVPRRVKKQVASTKQSISALTNLSRKPRLSAEYFWDSDIVNDDIIAFSREGIPCPPDALNMDEERLSPTGARPVIRTGAMLSGNEYLTRAAKIAFTDLAKIAADIEKKRGGPQRDYMQKQLFQETLRRLMVIAGITPHSFDPKNKYYLADFSRTRPNPQPEPQPPAPTGRDAASKASESRKPQADAEKEDLVHPLVPPVAPTDTGDAATAEPLNDASLVAQPVTEEPTREEPALIAEPVIEELPPNTLDVPLPPENTSASSEEQSPVTQPVEEEPVLAELADERSDEPVQEQPSQNSEKKSFFTRIKNFIWPARTTRAQAVQTEQQQAAPVPATQQTPLENGELGQRQRRETARPAPVPRSPQSNSGMGPWQRLSPSVPFDEYLGELEGRNEAGTGTGDLLRNYMNLRRKRFGAVFGQKTAASKPAEEVKSSEQAPADKKDAAPEKAKKAS